MRRYFGLLIEHQAMSATNTRATANAAARPTAEEMVMSDITISSAVGRAAAFAVALVFVALIAWCSMSSPKYRRMTKADHCMGMPVHAEPSGPLIGYVIGGALVDPRSGPVQAIDVSVVVDGETR